MGKVKGYNSSFEANKHTKPDNLNLSLKVHSTHSIIIFHIYTSANKNLNSKDHQQFNPENNHSINRAVNPYIKYSTTQWAFWMQLFFYCYACSIVEWYKRLSYWALTQTDYSKHVWFATIAPSTWELAGGNGNLQLCIGKSGISFFWSFYWGCYSSFIKSFKKVVWMIYDFEWRW